MLLCGHGPDAEKGKAVWARENDKRVTSVGRILRKAHIDEFPQFINILSGEMSAVGPRSERPEFVEELAREIPFYRMRHAVKPGMAGWGLVKQGYGASKEDSRIKLEYDLYYLPANALLCSVLNPVIICFSESMGAKWFNWAMAGGYKASVSVVGYGDFI